MEHSDKITIDYFKPLMERITVRPGILRLAHLYLIQNYPLKDVFEFWQKNLPDLETEPSTIQDFFDSILINNQKLPVYYVMKVLSAMEAFLIGKGDGSKEFARTLYSDMSNAGYGDNNKLIGFWIPSLKKINSLQIDTKYVIMRGCPKACRYVCHNFHLQILKESKGNGTYRHIFLFALKKNFQLLSPPFDCDLWIGQRVKMLPVLFGLPEYEQVDIISDVRSIEDISPGIQVIRENDRSQVGAVKAREYSFGEFLALKDVTLPRLDLKSLKAIVVEVLDDYYCPKRKRIILHKGCVYSAPVYLFQVTYPESKYQNAWDMVANTMKIMNKEKVSLNRLRTLHEEFLRQADSKCIFLYDKQTDTITLNGKYFIRNVPAKILAKMIKHYVECGCHGSIEIERKSLLNDPEIVPDRNNPNLERRFKLIAEAFRKKCPGCCCFSRPSKGVIKLEPKSQITFEER